MKEYNIRKTKAISDYYSPIRPFSIECPGEYTRVKKPKRKISKFKVHKILSLNLRKKPSAPTLNERARESIGLSLYVRVYEKLGLQEFGIKPEFPVNKKGDKNENNTYIRIGKLFQNK